MHNRIKIGGNWFIAKPKNQPIFIRILWAISILRGEAQAVIFQEDVIRGDHNMHQEDMHL
jgi:hypothetical protein